MNERNRAHRRYNKGNKKNADNKLLTKKILRQSGIPVPETFGVIRKRHQVDDFNYDALPKSFVLKPARGVKGAGINIYYNRTKDGKWVLADKKRHSVEDIKTHVYNILEGQFSFGVTPKPSPAVFEERIKMHTVFKSYSYRGIPDIRVIVFRGIPIMAMLRLPTEESQGKANISRGAIGVGIDMARGITTTAIKNGRIIENVPGKSLKLSGIKIPYWTKILRISHQCFNTSGLGYLGVDIIIDRDNGPMVVELNARPGLGIQVANQDGLKERMDKVKRVKVMTENKAVRLSKDLFGGEIDEEIESISGREVIGLTEVITLTGKDKKHYKFKFKVDTGAESSSIDKSVAKILGYQDAVKYAEDIIKEEQVAEKPKEERLTYLRKLGKHDDIVAIARIKSATGTDYRVKVQLPAVIKEKDFNMRANIANRKRLTYNVIIGKNDLKEFLIDPTKGGLK
jgi:alpha-L-glutamate ligase-like protein